MTIVTNPAVEQGDDDSTGSNSPQDVPQASVARGPLAVFPVQPRRQIRYARLSPRPRPNDLELVPTSGYLSSTQGNITPINIIDVARHFRPGVRPDLEVPEFWSDGTRATPESFLAPRRPPPREPEPAPAPPPPPTPPSPVRYLGGVVFDEDEAITMQECRLRLRFHPVMKCDVIFVAGLDNDIIRYPAHRKILSASSPVFEALLKTDAEEIVIDYVDRRGFEQLMRWHYIEEPQINSVYMARCTLDASYKFLCDEMVRRCVCRLDEILNGSVALELMTDLRYMCAQMPGAASAPPLEVVSDAAADKLAKCTPWIDALAHNTFLVLDDDADAAVTDERLLELTYEDLSLIVKRPTFRVSDEFLLVSALHRWATNMCKKNQRELTSANRRTALGELSYAPRYLLMKGEKLDRALAMELLEPMERKLVLAQARKLSAPVPVGAEQQNMLRRWSRPRPKEPAALPVALSRRSKIVPDPSLLCWRRRLPIQPTVEPVEKKVDGCCTCFGEGLLRAFICLFD